MKTSRKKRKLGKRDKVAERQTAQCNQDGQVRKKGKKKHKKEKEKRNRNPLQKAKNVFFAIVFCFFDFIFKAAHVV